MLDLAVIYLAAAVVAVPIAKRLGLGSVLGYLLAGILIGPFLMGLVGDQTEIMHFAEFGVVMMLFLVGLELQPARLWSMRRAIMGLGGLQVTLTALVIWGLCMWLLQLQWQTAMTIGLMLALSSTAIVLQSLSEKGWIKTQAGQNAFSVLLFQDIAVIPILAMLPLLAFRAPLLSVDSHASLIEHFPVWIQVVISLAVIVGIVVAGKYISAPLFRYIAETRLKEIFTVFALLLVVAIALVMQKVGLSPALGTFLAGVVLAESDFRHELEVDIEPFKGLLLGLFFITVGASIDFPLLINDWSLILMLVFGLIVIKALILLALSHVFKLEKSQKLLFTLALAQGGEFAFVLLSMSTNLQLLTPEQSKLITLVVAISMLMAPLLLLVYEKFSQKDFNEKRDFDAVDDIEATKNVIIAGYGRFGQIVGRLLVSQGHHFSVLDHSPSQIDLVRRFGNKAFYGDAGRKELLDAAGTNEAQLLVIAINDPDKTLEIVELAQKHYPQIKIAVRAYDRRHAYQLMQLGIQSFKRETFDAAVALGIDALQLLGNSNEAAQKAGKIFRQHDEKTLRQLSEIWGDDKSYGVAIKQGIDDLKQVLNQDKLSQQQITADYQQECKQDGNNA